jgi:hypothetical protein
MSTALWMLYPVERFYNDSIGYFCYYWVTFEPTAIVCVRLLILESAEYGFLCEAVGLKMSCLPCCSDNLNEMLGELFLPRDMPEAPKQGFFKNLFGIGSSTLDREELCKHCGTLFVCYSHTC